MKLRIAVLLHDMDRDFGLESYLLTAVLAVWKDQGHEILPVLGAREFVPADLAILHVDLSVVPEEYLDLAARYPRALNGRVRDIRKSAFSPYLLRPGDAWTGPVIVKSDRNFGGFPEAARGIPRLAGDGMAPVFRSPLEYRVLDNLAAVPPEWFGIPDLVIQRFVPEVEDDLFHVRAYTFFGDVHTSTRIASDQPIVKSQTRVATATVPPHPEIVRLRHAMGFDYGKFDYVVHGGEAILLDANKTPGLPNPRSPRAAVLAGKLAAGLEGFLLKGR